MFGKKPVAAREYNFEDGTLQQLADAIAAMVTRDLAALASRGVTAATVTHLEDLRDTFSDTPTDTQGRALVTVAVEEKNDAREAALIEARRLRVAAQNTFGENTGKYNLFGFEGMDRQREDALPRVLKAMHKVGAEQQAQLAAEGIDAIFLSEFFVAIGLLDSKLDAVVLAEQQRDKYTEERISEGNILYKEIVRICNIGKDVFAPVSEATYNDYVIENYVGDSNLPATSLVVKGIVTFGLGEGVEGALVSVQGANPPAFNDETNEDGRYRFRFNNIQPGEITAATLTVSAMGFETYSQPIAPVLGEVNVYNVTLTQALQIAA